MKQQKFNLSSNKKNSSQKEYSTFKTEDSHMVDVSSFQNTMTNISNEIQQFDGVKELQLMIARGLDVQQMARDEKIRRKLEIGAGKLQI